MYFETLALLYTYEIKEFTQKWTKKVNPTYILIPLDFSIYCFNATEADKQIFALLPNLFIT